METVDKLPVLENDPNRGGRLCLTGGRLNLHNALCYKPHRLKIDKTDDVNDSNCVLPGQNITYTIHYDANGHGDSSVMIIDYLPDEVEPNDPLDPNYDAVSRTYIWDIGTIPPDGNGTVTLTVQVNNLAEPCGVITNLCKIEGDHSRSYTETSTSVCAWNRR